MLLWLWIGSLPDAELANNFCTHTFHLFLMFSTSNSDSWVWAENGPCLDKALFSSAYTPSTKFFFLLWYSVKEIFVCWSTFSGAHLNWSILYNEHKFSFNLPETWPRKNLSGAEKVKRRRISWKHLHAVCGSKKDKLYSMTICLVLVTLIEGEKSLLVWSGISTSVTVVAWDLRNKNDIGVIAYVRLWSNCGLVGLICSKNDQAAGQV